jgi:hypothetical protein
MSHRIAGSLRAELVPSWSCLQAASNPVWLITVLCVQWRTPDDGERNCLKYVEFHSKNKFEKLVHLVGFIMRDYKGFKQNNHCDQHKMIDNVDIK